MAECVDEERQEMKAKAKVRASREVECSKVFTLENQVSILRFGECWECEKDLLVPGN